MKRFKCAVLHILVICAALFVFMGIPFLASGGMRHFREDTDAVSGASVILEAPSGEYLILINEANHPDSGNLSAWLDFFSGGRSGVIFEDIDCIVLSGDQGGMEAARSFQSRLPEHQMRIRTEDGTLVLSKADHGLFDVIVMSAEAADAYGAETVWKNSLIRAVTVR